MDMLIRLDWIYQLTMYTCYGAVHLKYIQVLCPLYFNKVENILKSKFSEKKKGYSMSSNKSHIYSFKFSSSHISKSKR
jgi:hypothetical protein